MIIIKKKYLYELFGGISMVVLSIVLRLLLRDLNSRISGMIGAFGVGLAFVAILQNYRFGEQKVEQDERSKRICLKAQSYSWITTFFSIIGLGVLDTYVMDLNVEVVLTVLIFIISLSMLIPWLYLGRKPGNV